jgi:hypothetical protein
MDCLPRRNEGIVEGYCPFYGGRISSEGGVLLLAGADKQLGLIDRLAAIIPDHRDPAQITHRMADILRARIFAIACGRR